MDMGGGGGMLSNGISACSRRICEGISEQFPAGLRVLVVDDDPICLMILEKMLRNCLYEGKFFFPFFLNRNWIVWVFISFDWVWILGYWHSPYL